MRPVRPVAPPRVWSELLRVGYNCTEGGRLALAHLLHCGGWVFHAPRNGEVPGSTPGGALSRVGSLPTPPEDASDHGYGIRGAEHSEG